jgi:hypothetical protein
MVTSLCPNDVETSFLLRPIHPNFHKALLEKPNVVAYAIAMSLGKPLEWAVGFFFGNLELSIELYNVIAGISGMDDD